MAGTEALLASQINGGGCLPPPTPSAPAGQMFKEFGKALGDGEENKTAYQRYAKTLEPSLAFRCTTKTAMVQGVGGFIDSQNLKVPEVKEMGFIMKNGRLTRMDRPRRNGPDYFWQTASERVMRYHHDPQTLEL